MTHRLTTIYAKNYCNRTLIVKVIIENVVTCFLGHSVLLQQQHVRTSYSSVCNSFNSVKYVFNSSEAGSLVFEVLDS